jgi:hypothetical protein
MTPTTVDNVFSDELLNELFLYTRDGKQPTFTNFFGWDEGVIQTSASIHKFELPKEFKDKIIKELIAKGVYAEEPEDWLCGIQLHSRLAYIPWHSDWSWKETGTVYLNKNWSEDFGGYFAYKDDGEIKCIVPTYNKGVFFTPPLDHTVLLTAIQAPLRESLQIFVKKPEHK